MPSGLVAFTFILLFFLMVFIQLRGMPGRGIASTATGRRFAPRRRWVRIACGTAAVAIVLAVSVSTRSSINSFYELPDPRREQVTLLTQSIPAALTQGQRPTRGLLQIIVADRHVLGCEPVVAFSHGVRLDGTMETLTFEAAGHSIDATLIPTTDVHEATARLTVRTRDALIQSGLSTIDYLHRLDETGSGWMRSGIPGGDPVIFSAIPNPKGRREIWVRISAVDPADKLQAIAAVDAADQLAGEELPSVIFTTSDIDDAPKPIAMAAHFGPAAAWLALAVLLGIQCFRRRHLAASVLVIAAVATLATLEAGEIDNHRQTINDMQRGIGAPASWTSVQRNAARNAADQRIYQSFFWRG